MACLADFGFTTVVPDPENLVSPILELEGGTVMFMAPELLAPSKYGLTGAVPTQEADIYAFGLVVFQVLMLNRRRLLRLTFLQVLTGEQPFRDIRPRELAFSVLAGARPAKPENAVGIGFSEILWNLVQKCWDGEVARRPQIQEVVEGIGKVATSWFTSMPPGIMQRAVSDVEDDEDEDEDGVSEELKHGESSPLPVVLSRLSPSAQLQCLNYIRVKIFRLPTRVPTLHDPVIHLPSQLNPLRWKRMKCPGGKTPHPPLPVVERNARDLGAS